MSDQKTNDNTNDNTNDIMKKYYRETFQAIVPDEDVRQRVLADMAASHANHESHEKRTNHINHISHTNYENHANHGKRVQRRQIVKRVAALAACLCLLASVVLSNGLINPRELPSPYFIPLPTVRKTVEISTLQVESYSEVYEMLSAPSNVDIANDNYMDGFYNYGYGGGFYNNYAPNFFSASLASSIAPTAKFTRGDGGGYALTSNMMGGLYSGTNLQVAGVDEADVVKTDGKYIYALRTATYDDNTGKMKTPSEVVIIQAEGKDSRFLSRVSAPMPTETKSEDGKSVTTSATVFYDMYLAGDMLVIIADTSRFTQPVEGAEEYYRGYWWRWGGSNETTAFIYNIADRAAPILRDSFGQSGAYQTSRLADGVLYTITNHYVSYKGEQGDAELYVPQLYRGFGVIKNSLIPACDISIAPSEAKKCYSQYTVISAISIVDKLERLSTKTLLGSTDTIYASGENLLLAGRAYNEDNKYGPYEEIEGLVFYAYNEEKGESKQKEKEGMLYRHVTQTSSNSTNLVLFGTNGGNIELRATGEIPGNLLNQFSMDEYEGHFRIVTTVDNWVGDYFEDEDGDYASFEWDEGWCREYGDAEENYRYASGLERLYFNSHPQYKAAHNSYSQSSNALYVLDGALKRVGALEGLAEDERVYSVRFTGDIGYFVTYKQVDPLFTVDLSDPANPYIRSELKIPGFSEYLHPYDDGLLLGLGQDTAVNKEGFESRKGLKLSMFDVSDPDNVTEASVLALPFQWTEASSNHKAILVSRARALVAFPVDGSYAIYGYDAEEAGFFERAVVSIGEENWWQGNSRGLFIENDFYVISQNAVYIFSVADFSPLATVNIGK
ncbi:MAG: beta-propeller domain-containing protein [Oscillospiraceae bacterium]|nr:beta-propeller domain-containing protein [Oscillospiraceae bacterium]